ncbi:MAG TPA: glycerophosphodiester phosphodiesterase family protein [Pyrinomonadaceae bacterium]|nr:glycerophosphodiester phosphodiesterase family protein [Pyrinomonadaceae bacterium]
MSAGKDDAAARDVDAPRLPLVVGHRGASAHAPENTLAAFRRAFEDGADGLEFDVRLARDGVPVCIHDVSLARTGSRVDAVSSLTSEELRECGVGAWFNRRFPRLARAEYERERVPTLAEVFRETAVRARVLYVELKYEPGEDVLPLASEVARLTREHRLLEQVVVESFNLEAVRASKRLAPELRTAALFERRLARPVLPAGTILARASDCGADEIALHHTLARARTVAAARSEGFDALVWTVDRPAWAARALALGLRALITNRPALMRSALDHLAADRPDDEA